MSMIHCKECGAEVSKSAKVCPKCGKRLKKDNVDTEKEACKTHNKIGKIVRNAIKQAGRKYARRFTYT